METIRFRKSSITVKIIIVAFTALFIFNSFVCLFPIYFSGVNALKSAEEYFASSVAFPKAFQFENFAKVFTIFAVRGSHYFDMLINSLWILAVNVFVNALSSVLLAYALAKFRFPGNEFLYTLVIFAQTIPIIGSGAAGFKLRMQLNMIDNPLLIWLGWAGAFDFQFMVLYGTFKGISNTYSEAASIDGASELFILFRIVLPQAFPSIVAICITAAIGVWNNYSISMIQLRSYPTLAYGMYLFQKESYYIEDSQPVYFACALISCIPVVVLYACNQKLILTNMTAGGLKG